VGLAVKAGSFLISYIVSIKNPVASKDLYNDTGLSAYRQLNFWNYSVFVWYKILLYATQAYVALLLTRLKARSKSRFIPCFCVAWSMRWANGEPDANDTCS